MAGGGGGVEGRAGGGGGGGVSERGNVSLQNLCVPLPR